MARVKSEGFAILVFAALSYWAGAQFLAQSCPVAAQSQHIVSTQPRPSILIADAKGSASLSGKLTDLDSSPLGGVWVVLRNVATGAEARTTTAANGAYRFNSIDAGEYTLEAESPSLGCGHLEGLFVAPGHEARMQAAIKLEPAQGEKIVAAATYRTPTVNSPRPPTHGAEELAPSAGTGIGPVVSRAELKLPPLSGLAISEPSLRIARLSAPQPVAEDPKLTASLSAEPVRLLPITRFPGPDRAVPQLAVLASITEAMRPAVISSLLSAAIDAIPAAASPLALSILALQPLNPVAAPVSRPVLAAAQKPDPSAAAVTTTLTAEEIQLLPAAGRRWQEFVLNTPATAPTQGSSQASLRGAGQQSADIAIDGSSTRLAFGAGAVSGPSSTDSGTNLQSSGEQSGMTQAWSGSRGFSLSEAAVRQVQTVAGNVEFEAARGAGGRVNLETKRGTDQLHGQGFVFDRQNTWGARNPFTQWVQNLGSTAAPDFTPVSYTPPDHEIAWGLGIGSRVRRDKLFWFAALDSYRRNDPGVATVKNAAEFFDLPSANDARIQLLSAQLDESFNQAYNDYLGVPGAGYAPAGLEQLDDLLGPAPRQAAQWVGFARLDWQAAERHRVTFEGIGADWNSPGGGLTRVSQTYGNHSFGASAASEQWLLARWEAFATPNLLVTTQASAGRDILSAHAETPSAFEQGLLRNNIWGQLPQIVVDSRYGFTIGNLSRFGGGSYPDERLYHGLEAMDWVRNKLLVRAGFELDHNSDATSLLRNQTGTYYYSKVENFISDALAYEKFGMTNLFNYQNPHNCNPAGTGFGALPCYSYYSQTMGSTEWQLSTNDWAGYATAQWQSGKLAVFSVGLRWEREQLPPPLAAVANPQLAPTMKLPGPGNNWGPRLSLAIGDPETHWPLLRLGYGMYYGRTENATVETALTQTGSAKGDLNFFIRPTDGLNPITLTSGAPPFPYVLSGEPSSVVKPGAVQFAPNFRNPEVHQAVASVEEALPAHILVTAAAVASLGRRLPVSVDTNLDTPTFLQSITYAVVDGTGKGPIKAASITVPFYASWPGSADACPYHSAASTMLPGRPCPDYQQISEVMSRANSTYEAAMIKIARYGRRGLTLHAHYTYAHAMDWNPNETTLVAGSDLLDPADFSREYGTSNLDVRHSAAVMAIYETPWRLHNLAGWLANGWVLSGIGQFRSGLPFTMRTSGSLPEIFDQETGAAIVGLGPGMNGSGGDNRVFGMGSDGRSYSIGRNTYRYPRTWKADLRMAKRFDLGSMRQLEILAESFNLFNHQNVTELQTTGYYIEPGSLSSLPTLNFLTGLKANSTAFGQPLNINATDFYRERQIQIGVRMRF